MNQISPEGERDRLAGLIIEYHKNTFQAMQGSQMPQWLGSDLTMPQFKILFLLYAHGPLRMSGIANTLDKKISTATGIVDRLVEHIYVQREEDPEDRRVVLTALTEQGRSLCDSFLQAGWQHARQILDRLSLEELETVEHGMRLMARVAIEDAQERLQAYKTEKIEQE